MGGRTQIMALRRAAIWLLAACICLSSAVMLSAEASAQEQKDVPVPKPRPPVHFAEPQNLLLAKPKQGPEADETDTVPALPRARPRNGRQASDGGDATVVAPNLLLPVTRSAEEDEACRWRLRAIGVSFERWPTIARGGQCRVELPLLVSELSPVIALNPAAIMSCDLADALAVWMRDVVAPAARKHLSADVSGLKITSAFHCRSGGSDAVVDAHATGTAVDIVGLTFKEHDPLSIRDRRAEQGPEGAFQHEILTGACKLFTTVLSPGADFGSTETDTRHFHFDIAKRRDGLRICR